MGRDTESPLRIRIEYDGSHQEGSLSVEDGAQNALWDRIRQTAASLTDECRFSANRVVLPWHCVLDLVREYAPSQRRMGFSFAPTLAAKPEIDRFIAERKAAIAAKREVGPVQDEGELATQLRQLGFRKRELRPFQMRDLQRLLALSHGANFSVPGAGKTTVTLALHLLWTAGDYRLIVVAPKNAFGAWRDVIDECISDDAPAWVQEPFTVLTGGDQQIAAQLETGRTRFLVSYDQMINIAGRFRNYMSRNPTHLVLDESHRMKGGFSVQRGAVLLSASSLPARRDILSGTPMPQGPNDLASQMDFLWPGVGLGRNIGDGSSPRAVIGNLYVRTTKVDLGLPPVIRHFRHVRMSDGQAALYGVIREEVLREVSSLRAGSGIDIARARKSVMRLLQLSTNPTLALRAIVESTQDIGSGIVRRVLEEGPSPKMCEVRDLVRRLAREGKKTVVWTIFTDTIQQMETMLSDQNPVTIYGAVPSGDQSDSETREGRLRRFHEDPSCMTLIANPAAAGEGISLHRVCHTAIYMDRSYNSTHYLQSIDRIHRLGMGSDIETNIYIFQTTAPKGLGCIDHSVSRRLATKLRNLERLLEDEDLHRIALDEENADDPVDYDVNVEDISDLIAELDEGVEYDESEMV